MQAILDKAGRLLLTALQAGITAGQLSADASQEAMRQVQGPFCMLVMRSVIQ